MSEVTYESHPAATIFPLMGQEELDAVCNDIQEQGLLEPIVLLDNMILDGRNRARCCELLGITPTYVDADLGKMTPLQYVVSKNLHRRHLTVAQKAAIALDLLPELEAQAKARMSEGGRRSKRGQPGKGTLNSGDPKHTQTSAFRAAEMVGVGKSTVEAAKSIRKKGGEEIIEQMRSGEISVARAAELAGFERMSQSNHHGGRLKITDENGRVPAYGKGDKWVEATTPIRRYIAGWEKRNFAFRHINPREARKRLRAIEEMEKGLSAIRADLEGRSVRATTRVEGR